MLHKGMKIIKRLYIHGLNISLLRASIYFFSCVSVSPAAAWHPNGRHAKEVVIAQPKLLLLPKFSPLEIISVVIDDIMFEILQNKMAWSQYESFRA